MPRKDENGKGLQAVLSYLCDRAVPGTEIYGALGIARNTYHRRIEEESYPNAEECRLVANQFGLNPLDLQVRFGLIEQVHIEGFFAGPIKTTKKYRAIDSRNPQRLGGLSRRSDVPPV